MSLLRPRLRLLIDPRLHILRLAFLVLLVLLHSLTDWDLVAARASTSARRACASTYSSPSTSSRVKSASGIQNLLKALCGQSGQKTNRTPIGLDDRAARFRPTEA